jgi:hypothetical protein
VRKRAARKALTGIIVATAYIEGKVPGRTIRLRVLLAALEPPRP